MSAYKLPNRLPPMSATSAQHASAQQAAVPDNRGLSNLTSKETDSSASTVKAFLKADRQKSVNDPSNKQSSYSSFGSSMVSAPDILLEPPSDGPEIETRGLNDIKPAVAPNAILKSRQSSYNMLLDSVVSEEVFDVIRGPVQAQMLAHYSWFGLMLVCLHFSEWTFVYFWTTPMYIYACYAAWELSRLFLFKNANSLAPLYLSFIPYFIFLLFLRNADMVFSLAWYFSLMSINIQSGVSNMLNHLIGSTALFIGLYLLVLILKFYVVNTGLLNDLFVPGASVIYRDPVACDRIPLGAVYRTTSNDQCQVGTTAEVLFPSQLTFIVGLILLAVTLSSLQSFVHDYATNLIQRNQNVTQLTKQNEDLKTKLHALKKDINLDLDSPITKVIKSIKSMQDTCNLDVDVSESLDYVIQILSSNQLFMPNLEFTDDTIDNDVKNWLNSMIVNKTENGNDLKALASAEESQRKRVQIEIPKLVLGNESKISELLETIDTWDFDLFELNSLSNGNPLYYLAGAVVRKHNIREQFGIDEQTVQSFFRVIESRYRPLSYHNSMHAADVLHAVHFFFTSIGVNGKFKPDEVFAGIIAAAVHDVDHPGVTNAYLVASANPLALRYNDIAVLENHHCATAFEIMASNPACNILGSLPVDKVKTIRSVIVAMVLATDMANHFEFIAKFKIKVSGMVQGSGGLDFEDAKDRQLTLQIFIKCGDISNAAKSLSVCKQWAEMIMEEFFLQGDEESKNGYAVSMFMDRRTTFIPKCQVGFVDYIVLPLYEALGSFLHATNQEFVAVTNLISNRDYWKSVKPANQDLALT